MVIKFTNLTKWYKKTKVVDELNLEIEGGTVLGFLGPNGAGKTTTIKMACGLVKPTFGDIEVSSVSLLKHKKEYIKNIGAVLEGNRNLYWKLTPLENIEYFASLRGINFKTIKEKTEHYIDIFELNDKKNTVVSSLSRGMQQKVAIICSLVHNPKVLFLDEPTLGLDVQSVALMEEVLKEIISEQRIIIVTSHNLSFVSNVCTSVAIINKGKLMINENIDFLDYYSSKLKYKLRVRNFNRRIGDEVLNKYDVKLDYSAANNLYIEVRRNNDIVKILNHLNSNNVIIENINQEKIELKDVFIDVINEEKERWGNERSSNAI